MIKYMLVVMLHPIEIEKREISRSIENPNHSLTTSIFFHMQHSKSLNIELKLDLSSFDNQVGSEDDRKKILATHLQHLIKSSSRVKH